MQVRMTRVPVSDERFMMTAAGAKGTRPAGVAIVLGVDVAASEKIALFFPVDSGRNMSHRVSVGIHKAMAWSKIARRPDAKKPERRAARMRFVHSLNQLGDRVAA